MLLIGPQGIPAVSNNAVQWADGLVWVIAVMAALIALRSSLRPCWLDHSGLASQSGCSRTSQNRFHIRPELAAMVIAPSVVGNTPVGIPVG